MYVCICQRRILLVLPPPLAGWFVEKNKINNEMVCASNRYNCIVALISCAANRRALLVFTTLFACTTPPVWPPGFSTRPSLCCIHVQLGTSQAQYTTHSVFSGRKQKVIFLSIFVSFFFFFQFSTNFLKFSILLRKPALCIQNCFTPLIKNMLQLHQNTFAYFPSRNR